MNIVRNYQQLDEQQVFQFKRMDREDSKSNEELLQKMAMTNELTHTLSQVHFLFGDLQPLISKHLTPTGFWFLIDAMNFQRVSETALDRTRNEIVQDIEVDIQDFSQVQELEFILKIRKLVSTQKGTLNMPDILSTTIDEVIEAAEHYQTRLNYENSKQIEQVNKQIKRQNTNIDSALSKFGMRPREAHPMFVYEELEDFICQRWAEEQKKKKNLERCYICSNINRLISCKSCNLKVHQDCYPSFPHKTSKNSSKEDIEKIREARKNFQCQNCRNQIDSETETCCLCCCVGGSFLKTCQFEGPSTVSLEGDQNTQGVNSKVGTHLDFIVKKREEKKPKLVHVSCFLWNSEAKWNHNTRMVEGIGKIDRKKMNGMCSLCGITFGAAIPCCNESCRRFYHAECARRNNLEMNFFRAKTSVIELFCERHRHLKKYEAIIESHANKMRDVRKLFDGLDKEIKRQNSISGLPQLKVYSEKDLCTSCGREEGFEKITVCKECRKWHHNSCSSFCQNCLL